ncbi:hypothetical protein AWENTII_002699 [Aspergillus wentii]
MAGLFPSNFVEVLGEDFVPVSQTTSQMIKASPSPITNPTSAPKKQKTVFRKPFQAHKEALAPSASAELARSSTNVAPATSSIPQTPPRHGSLPRSIKPLRTPATAVKNHSSLTRPSSRSKPPSRAISPRPPQDPEVQQPVPARHNSTQPRSSPSRADSPRPTYELEMSSPVPTRSNIPLSRPPSRGISPHPTYEPEIAPMALVRHNPSRTRPPSRGPSPQPMYEPEIPPPVPIRQNTSQPRSPSRAVSPHPFYDPEMPPPVPIRGSSSQPRPTSRAVSPRPMYEPELPSPTVPSRQLMTLSRPVSREISPLQLQDREESPPPPPPPHRVAVNRPPSRDLRLPAPFDMNDRYITMSRTPSPAARSDVNGHTPSPLRDAMEDVMTSLEDMGMPRETPSPSPEPVFNNPWSPDAYDSFRGTAPKQNPRRPLTSLGFDGDKDYQYNTVPAPAHRNSIYTHDHYMDGPPQLNNYVQRMESRLRQMQEDRRGSEDVQFLDNDEEEAPPPPPKNVPYHGRHNSIPARYPYMGGRRSGQDIRGDILNRSYTNKSSTTNSSSGVQSNGTNVTASTERTSQSLMSGPSAGGFSATSAGSYARRGPAANERPNTAMDTFRSRGFSDVSRVPRPETPLTGVSYHSSHNSSRQGASSAIPWSSPGNNSAESAGILGGLATPKAKKHGFFKKIFESAKTGAASARSSIAVGQGQNGGSYSPTKGRPVSPIPSPNATPNAAREMGLGSGGAIDWVQVRRDVNRASSPSRNERIERAERCQMMDHPVIYAVEELHETAEGDESIDGLPINEPTNFASANLTLVDKSARFVNSLPPMTNPMSLAQGYICRPYKSDVQRLRAIFTWVSEKISWDDPVEEEMDVDLKRVLQTKRGSPQEVAFLVNEMCAAVGLHAEAIKGFLKPPGELLELDSLSRPNHWWNAVLVDGEWRIIDCALANPTNPRRNQYVTNLSSTAESWYFLARPMEICYTHVPLYPEEQHICPPISPDVLLALPTACPPYFKMNMQFPDYDTSIIRIEGLEVMQIRLLVPLDVECAAEVEAPAFACDADGDFFESGEIVRKRALVQPDWVCGQKRYTVKAVLPGDEGQGMVKVYAGKKGLMHSSRDIPHPLALALPIIQTGDNPPYDFVLRHPTPHAQRHDLYIMQPQCSKLAINNTFVFAVRQHPSSPASSSQGGESSTNGRVSPSIFARPASALSMVSSSAGGPSASTVSNEFSASTSAISSRSGSGREKPAKLAIQSPSGKILRLTRKADHMIGSTDSASDAPADGSVWETVIKIGERGTWRGLVLADRVARWCVFCEWECF